MKKVKGFSYDTERDKYLIAWIDKQPNKSWYILDLVKQDIEKKQFLMDLIKIHVDNYQNKNPSEEG